MVGPRVSGSSRQVPRGQKGLRLQWSPKQKPRCGISLGRLWRQAFSWPQGSSGKPSDDSGRESIAWLPRGEELLTLTGDIVQQWKEQFEELLNPTNTSSLEEAAFEDSEEVSPIFLAEVSKVVKKLLSGKAPHVDEIHPELLKALLQCLVEVRDSD